MAYTKTWGKEHCCEEKLQSSLCLFSLWICYFTVAVACVLFRFRYHSSFDCFLNDLFFDWIKPTKLNFDWFIINRRSFWLDFIIFHKLYLIYLPCAILRFCKLCTLICFSLHSCHVFNAVCSVIVALEDFNLFLIALNVYR